MVIYISISTNTCFIGDQPRINVRSQLLAGTVPPSKNYLDGTVPSSKMYLDGTVPSTNKYGLWRVH